MQIAMMQSAQDNLSFNAEPDPRTMTAPSGFNSKPKNMQVHDHAEGENIECTEDNCEYQIRGRQICLGECRFVFERVWKVTCAHHNAAKEGEECNDDERFEQEILISDLFHIIDLAG